MRLLIIGGGGMAGHLLADYFREQPGYELWYTVRGEPADGQGVTLDVRSAADVADTLRRIRPDAVVNAAGLLNAEAARHLPDSIRVNSLLPHSLAALGRREGFRLIHISTDCVFSGTRGGYLESDPPDGTGAYAMTKALGEVVDDTHLTIRTSIIGPELKRDGIGLFHWFMRQTGTVSGYTGVYWNGVTTLQLAKTVQWTLGRPLTGLVHLTGTAKVSKYELLRLIGERFGRGDIRIVPDAAKRADKSLVNTRGDFTAPVPGYADMLDELGSWMRARGSARYAQYARPGSPPGGPASG